MATDSREEQLRQLGDSIKTNERVMRVLKKGFYPASVGADVQNSIDYFKRLNNLWAAQIKQIKNAPKKEDAMVSEPIPAPELNNATDVAKDA